VWCGFQDSFNDAGDGAIMNVFRRIPELSIRVIHEGLQQVPKIILGIAENS
jgi:hypothetical protein